MVAVLGAPGTGKSMLVKEADARGAWSRRLVYEPHGRRDRVEEARGRRLYPWPGRLVSVTALLARPELLDVDPLRLVCVPDALDEKSRGEDFAAVGRLAWHTGGLTVIGEEFAIYARFAVEVANLIATGGRHAGLRLIVISQSWGRIPIDVRRCVTHVVAFAQSEAGDLRELRPKLGARRTAEVARLKVGDPPVIWRQGDALD